MKSLRLSVDPLGPAFVAIWSSGYVVGSLATRYSAPFAITLWRFLIAAAALGVIARWRGESWPRGAGALVRTGVTGVVMYGVQFCALYLALADGMPAATTALIACSAPLVVALGGAALGWDRLTGRQWAGVTLGVAGVAVTVSDRVGRPPSVHALLWTLLGLAGLAGGSLLQSRLVGLGGATALTTLEVAAGAGVTAVVAVLAGPLTIAATLPAWTSFLWLALVTGIGAPLLLFALIARRGPTQGTSLLFVVPAVTAFVAWPVLGQPVGVVALLGLVVAGVGLWLARRRPAAVTTRRTPEPAEPVEPVAPVGVQ
jgi:drug/metabolite transporter (DMT)-like permease